MHIFADARGHILDLNTPIIVFHFKVFHWISTSSGWSVAPRHLKAYASGTDQPLTRSYTPLKEGVWQVYNPPEPTNRHQDTPLSRASFCAVCLKLSPPIRLTRESNTQTLAVVFTLSSKLRRCIEEIRLVAITLPSLIWTVNQIGQPYGVYLRTVIKRGSYTRSLCIVPVSLGLQCWHCGLSQWRRITQRPFGQTNSS